MLLVDQKLKQKHKECLAGQLQNNLDYTHRRGDLSLSSRGRRIPQFAFVALLIILSLSVCSSVKHGKFHAFYVEGSCASFAVNNTFSPKEGGRQQKGTRLRCWGYLIGVPIRKKSYYLGVDFRGPLYLRKPPC